MGIVQRAEKQAASALNEGLYDAHDVIYDLLEQRAKLLEALKEASSVCNSVSLSKHRKIDDDGDIYYGQTEEWCKWVSEEVAPMVDAAIKNAERDE